MQCGKTTGILLPPELHEAIIDQIDDSATLKTCALVCMLFRRRCQQILFMRVSLRRPYRTMSHSIVTTVNLADRFLELIFNSPHLCKLVHALDISDDNHLNFYREGRSWIRHDTSLQTILPRLDHLKELSISGNAEGNRLDFRAWNVRLREAIMIKSKSPEFTSLTLNHVRNVPFHLLSSATSLKRLNIHRSCFVHGDDPDRNIHIQKPMLKMFNFTSITSAEWTTFHPWLKDEECTIDLTHLSHLSLHVDYFLAPPEDVEEITAISWLLRQCARTVEILDLFCSDSALSRGEPILDLGAMPVLRFLILQGCILDKNTLQWFTDTLNKALEHSLLKSIDLHYTISETDMILGSNDVDIIDWTGFVSAILHLLPRASVLVAITILQFEGTAEMALQCQRVLEDKLSSLMQCGILDIGVEGLV